MHGEGWTCSSSTRGTGGPTQESHSRKIHPHLMKFSFSHKKSKIRRLLMFLMVQMGLYAGG